LEGKARGRVHQNYAIFGFLFPNHLVGDAQAFEKYKYGKRKVICTAGSLHNRKGYATMQGPGIIGIWSHICSNPIRPYW